MAAHIGPDARIAMGSEPGVVGVVAEGDTVITTWTLRGIHRGEFLGIAPSGNNVEVTGTTLHRVEGGVIVAARVNWDTLTLMRQIGALP